MNPVEVVTRYLRLVEQRQLEEARGFLMDNVEIIFPGGRRFADLDEQVASSRERYRDISKVFEEFDLIRSDGYDTVYAIGTLKGTDLAGRSFDSVRFIDRFQLEGGLISKHHVWNDMAESHAGDPHHGGRDG